MASLLEETKREIKLPVDGDIEMLKENVKALAERVEQCGSDGFAFESASFADGDGVTFTFAMSDKFGAPEPEPEPEAEEEAEAAE